jgi:FAD/FMN-containing dehydrogenase
MAGALVLSPLFGRGRAALDSDHPFAELEVELDGDLLQPSNSRYDELRRVASFNPLTDKHPAAIACCASEADVARSVVFATERGHRIAVRSGGHDILGASVCDGGLLIDLSPMKTTQIDPRARILRCGPGLRAGEVDRATQPFGLAAPLGCNPVVGIAGLTLGGGIGWFAGKHGATCDNLIRARIVGADGQIRSASRDENPDLFWALQGGGGNFGIASSLDYTLHPVAQVLGGLLAYPVGRLHDVLRVYRDLLADAPDELTVEISIQTLVEPIIMAMVCHAGDPGAGERLVEPLRRLAPVSDTVDLVDYARLTDRPGAVFALQSIGLLSTLKMIPRSFGASPEYGHWRGASLPELSDAAIDDFAEAIAAAPREWSIGIGHYMHGAICRRPAEETPLLRPPGRFTFFFGADWSEPHEAEDAMSWVDTSWRSVAPRGGAVSYVNYLSDGSPEAVRAAYGEHYVRLAQIKRVYDPENVFQLNRNILPAS